MQGLPSGLTHGGGSAKKQLQTDMVLQRAIGLLPKLDA
jgi:hypothetical protein